MVEEGVQCLPYTTVLSFLITYILIYFTTVLSFGDLLHNLKHMDKLTKCLKMRENIKSKLYI